MKQIRKKKIKVNHLKDNLQLLFLTLPAIVLLGLFAYWPMFGIVLAFKNYSVTEGIWGSPWAGLKNFKFFFEAQDAWRVARNTLVLNFMFIFVGLVCAVIFALLMFEVKKRSFVKLYQTVAILPNFISWVAVAILVYTLLEPYKGIVNRVIERFSGTGVMWYSEPSYWPWILLFVNLWHSVGLGSIIYYAALMGIDTSLFEAAEIDGANKLQRIRYISLPHLKSIVIIKTIMSIGGIFRADFGLFYNVPRNVGILYPTTDVMDTYVYRALMEVGNVGMSSAVGLFQSVVCFVVLMITNTIVRRVSPEDALF